MDQPDSGSPSLMDLSEDTLVSVLSFLTPKDLLSCSRVSRLLRQLCSDDGKVWLPLCERRWGSFTDPRRWGDGRISHRLLHSTLSRWENLIGFWRSVGTAGSGFLALFEWASDRLVGYKVVPALPDSYSVRKIPFLWMGISGAGQTVCLLDPSCRQNGRPDATFASSQTSSADAVNSFETRVDVFSAYPEASDERDMLLVDVHFVGNHHLVVEEISEHPAVAVNELAQAVTIAAFGQSHILDGKSPSPSDSILYPSNFRSPHSSSSESESYAGSPPGSFQYEMYQFLANKVISSGGERAARKQRKREKGRGLGQRRWGLSSEHFVKVIHPNPTKSRPLQGLWKGFFDSVGLDFVLVSYNDKEGEIICRRVQDLAGAAKCGSVLWTSLSNTRVGTPLSIDEQTFYNSCSHIRPSNRVMENRSERCPASFLDYEEVIGMQRTFSCDFQSLLSSDNREGRIWLYADGSFGFGHLRTNSVIDFRAMCTEGCLLDSVD